MQFSECKSHFSRIQIYIAGKCPIDFDLNLETGSCYKIITPLESEGEAKAKSQPEARADCQSRHKLADLVSIDTEKERNFVANLLAQQPCKEVEVLSQ